MMCKVFKGGWCGESEPLCSCSSSLRLCPVSATIVWCSFVRFTSRSAALRPPSHPWGCNASEMIGVVIVTCLQDGGMRKRDSFFVVKYLFYSLYKVGEMSVSVKRYKAKIKHFLCPPPSYCLCPSSMAGRLLRAHCPSPSRGVWVVEVGAKATLSQLPD